MSELVSNAAKAFDFDQLVDGLPTHRTPEGRRVFDDNAISYLVEQVHKVALADWQRVFDLTGCPQAACDTVTLNARILSDFAQHFQALVSQQRKLN